MIDPSSVPLFVIYYWTLTPLCSAFKPALWRVQDLRNVLYMRLYKQPSLSARRCERTVTR